MKRVLSLLLAIVMVFGLIPMAAFADGEPTISFETTFEDTMTVGDTFTVTASLANNPGVASMTVSLKWNEDVVKFNGFKTEYDEELEEDALVTDVFKSVWEPVVNDELGIITAARSKDTKKTGTLFVANFEVVGYGELEIGLKNVDISEFQMKPAEGDNLVVTFDDAAISDLSVAAPEPEGPAIPDGAPFTAVTTDAGAVTAIEYVDEISPAYGDPIPYYHISIPEGATEVYVTDPNQLVMDVMDYVTMENLGEKATAYLADINDGWNMITANYEFEQLSGAVKVIIPMEMTVQDMGSGTEIEVSFPADEEGEVYYAFAGENADYHATYALTFAYSDGGETTPTYAITINQPTGGTVSAKNESGETITKAAEGDNIFLANEPEEGYQFKHYLINGVAVTEAELGMSNGFYTMPGEEITISAVFEALHTCSYDQEVADEKYYASEATCEHGVVYYKSCTCGEFATTAETFYCAETVDHDYVDGICKWCDEAATEPILSFTAGGQTLEAVTAEDNCSEFEVTAQKLTVTVPAGVNTVTINCAASMCVYIDHVSSDLSPSGKSAEIDLTQDLTFVCVPVTLDDGSDAYYHVYFEQEAGDVDPEPEDPVVTPGYSFATSADVSAENGDTAVISVKITGHSDPTVTTYNAYDLSLIFDTEKLEYVSCAGAVVTDGGEVKVEGNTIRIVGCGADKDFGTEIAALTFKTKAEGNANVTISKVQVSDKNEVVNEDIAEATPKYDEDDTTADETPDVSVVIVPFSVSKPDYIDGDTIVLPGDTYEFSFADTENYDYTDLSVTVGGVPVEGLTPNEEGKYIIENVNGTIVITATQTAKSYSVTVVDGGATVNAPETATYGETYSFTVAPIDGKVIESIKVTKTDDATAEISYEINADGAYEIEGTDITADFTITVAQKDEPVAATTTITFTGVGAAEVEGGLTQTATVGREFTFRLNKAEGFTYTAKVGETDLAETAATDTVPAFFTIPADLVVEGGVTVTIAKTEIRNLKVEVSPYFNTDGATMFLVIAKDGEKVLSYGEEVMFYSSIYALSDEEDGAYCWLVSSSEALNSTEAVKAAAEAAIKTADATVEAPIVAYDCDVNQTNKVDVNDAQLAYDMYKGEYQLDDVAMDKFLEADMSTDKKLDVNDVAAIINIIVNGNNS